MKLRSVLFFTVLLGWMLAGCGEKSAYEQKAEADAKERAEENRAAHEARK
jgi:hypothetical protein